jgi:uncharacterized protein with von Willebrand factor type A (vWA) domain
VKSARHADLFDQLAKDYFKGFDAADGRVWVRFGYDYNGRVPAKVMQTAAKSKKATA